MKVRQDRAYRQFLGTSEEDDWQGVRIKRIRERPLYPGGRTKLTLFETAGEGGRPHPRMQTSMPPAEDPNPPGQMFAPEAVPGTAGALRQQIYQALRAHSEVLSADNLDMSAAPPGSPRYWKNSIRVQRIETFFDQVRRRLAAWNAQGRMTGESLLAARRVVRKISDEVYATTMEFDDDNTGTYHSYLHDDPFVHYLEALLSSLPREGTEAFAVLPEEAQHSIRRQRAQIQNHLDYLMRHKYAYEIVKETDIERTVGGFLIDRETRRIVSEVPDVSSLVPRYELLRIDPEAAHEYAGTWVYRDGRGGIRLQDHTPVTVEPGMLRSVAIAPERLTFRRAPGDPNLRPGIRFDWDRSGFVQAGEIDWVSWAGHCDIKAVMEQLGIVLESNPSLTEYRSDTDTAATFDRNLLLEMVASSIELGSVYKRVDSTGALQRGVHRFGGARNDSLPDRLQFQGHGEGRHFRWPLGGRKESFMVTSIAWPNPQGELEQADLGTVYFRYLPDVDNLSFRPNPRFIKTVEGDYNLIDVSGALITASLLVDDFDEDTGYPTERRLSTNIDLRFEPRQMRSFLGTHIADAARRRLYRFYLDRTEGNRIIGELFVYELQDGKWRPRKLEDGSFTLPLVSPLWCSLSHEMKRDHPEMYQALLDVALRKAQNICADTDRTAPVWNGVVTKLEMSKIGENLATRTEHWQVNVLARYGRATLAYLVRRNEAGEPVAYCPAVPETHYSDWPDFLWQDFPDVGTKGFEGSDWIVNQTMLEREIISLREDDAAPGGFYVYDDHIKNVFEIMFTALAGYRFSIVHANKRYGFESESAWRAAVAELKRRRAQLTFENDE